MLVSFGAAAAAAGTADGGVWATETDTGAPTRATERVAVATTLRSFTPGG